MRTYFQKQVPIIISYRDFKKFDQTIFRYELLQKLDNVNEGKVDCDTFETVCVALLNQHAPIKVKYTRANNQPFMNRKLSKAVMTRSRL